MPDLYSLYKLHKIDAALYSLRQQAAALDTGEDEKKSAAQLAKEYAEVGANAKALTTETKDREIQQKGFEEKIVALNKKLFDGSIVSPKEIGNVEKEIGMIKELSEKNDERLLALYEEAPPVVAQAKSVEAKIKAFEEAAGAKRSNAVSRHAEIKTEFEGLRQSRPEYVSQVDQELLKKYEEIRKHTGNVGMAVITEDKACELCGNSIPEKTLAMLNEDKIMTCEDCRRILFRVVPED